MRRREFLGASPLLFSGTRFACARPLHCSEIREGRTENKVCRRLGKLAAAKVEDLIRPA